MTECCCSCGQPLWVERILNHKLGGDSSTRIDFCLDCQTKALHSVLAEVIDRVPDPKRRQELYRKWSKAGTSVRIDDLAEILDN